MPCSEGSLPVSRLAWAVQVPAGTTSWSGRTQTCLTSDARLGACASKREVRPTALIRTTGASSRSQLIILLVCERGLRQPNQPAALVVLVLPAEVLSAGH